ncbi:hypothetical protein [Chryseobacterium sp.]|uniref:hypothetical protein n=1 Tax=Chryseobacterium sp. TaxID=1871047 RepID=UPI002601BB6E|nr:hypothetical protein [Chryseobacterium sp.]
MKKNLLFRLCLMMIALLSLYSCIHDEIYSSSDPSSTEYTNKSLWKQDKKYIKNVMKVYAENEAEIKKVNGIPYWNYATTVDSFDESFVAVPVVNEGKVISVMKVPRHGKNIYFYYTHDESDLKFFQGLVFAKYKKAGMADGSIAQTDGIACTRKWMSIWLPDSESNPDPDSGAGHWSTVSIIKCEATKDECIGIALPNGDCDLSGGNEGGYEYPGGGGEGTEPEEEEDPCDKLKAQNINTDYQNKVTDLNKTSVFNKDHETGYSENKNGNFTELTTSDSDALNITVDANTRGYIHAHLNDKASGRYDDQGIQLHRQPIRMFSPADVNTLMLIAGFRSEGDYEDIYGTMISSYGIYTIKFTGTSADIQTGFNTEEWSKDYQKYRIENKYLSLEKLFLTFLKDKMNIQGVELYKIKSNGTIQKKTLSTNNQIETTDCPD